MKTARSAHPSIKHESYVYVFGGDKAERACERYSLEQETWENIGHRNEPGGGSGGCLFKGKIYLAGGLTRNRIETYDPRTKQFGLLPFTLLKTGACSLVPHENKIIVFQSGG
jgi:hypothetical protein